MIILGIETSCDETGVALCSDFKILSSFTKTQSIHQQYGGVVPEIASREHEKYLPSITKKVLEDANKSFKDIDAIAVTNGPGLMGSLLSGISFAKGISQALNIPIIPINHLEALLNSVFIEHAELEAPFINLLVSGGHTQLWLVKNMFEYELLGETLDDAIGEAFDKCGKKIGLGYPAGPEIDKLSKMGDEHKFNFPYLIDDAEALDIVFTLIEKEGLFLGLSSGINIAGAKRLAKDLEKGSTIVTILCDLADRYKGKMFNIDFLKENNLPVPEWL